MDTIKFTIRVLSVLYVMCSYNNLTSGPQGRLQITGVKFHSLQNQILLVKDDMDVVHATVVTPLPDSLPCELQGIMKLVLEACLLHVSVFV